MILRDPPLVATCRAFVAVAALALSGGAIAAPVKAAHVEAELVAATTALVPGAPAAVAHYQQSPTPNLIVIESSLPRQQMLAELDRLVHGKEAEILAV